MNKPDIIVITSQKCGHCITFRGKNGIPSYDKPLNYNYIEKLLKLSSHFIEINISTMSNLEDNISEINIYFINSENLIERISIKRGAFNIIDIYVTVNEKNGIDKEISNEKYMNDFFWKLVPSHVLTKRNTEIKNLNTTEIRLYDQEIKKKYDFSWLLPKIISPSIRNYEKFYPCWMLVEENSWKYNNVYARVVNNITIETENGFSIEHFSGNETIETLLNEYNGGNLSLNSSQIKSKNKFSWQN